MSKEEEFWKGQRPNRTSVEVISFPFFGSMDSIIPQILHQKNKGKMETIPNAFWFALLSLNDLLWKSWVGSIYLAICLSCLSFSQELLLMHNVLSSLGMSVFRQISFRGTKTIFVEWNYNYKLLKTQSLYGGIAKSASTKEYYPEIMKQKQQESLLAQKWMCAVRCREGGLQILLKSSVY